MYLYLGGETVINTKEIIGIFDMDTSTVVCKDKIYVCPFNTSTLAKRCK